jgi:phage N-6-adenine-methyltransferase
MDKKTQDVLFSSSNMNWETPKYLVKAAQTLIGKSFTLDACAESKKVSKAPKFITPAQDALTKDWTGVVWMNPPYGKALGRWVAKAYEESLKGALVVCLLPARVDTVMFHRYCVKGDVYLLKGRITFELDGQPVRNAEGHATPATFPSMLVVFDRTKRKHTISVLEVPRV